MPRLNYTDLWLAAIPDLELLIILIKYVRISFIKTDISFCIPITFQ